MTKLETANQSDYKFIQNIAGKVLTTDQNIAIDLKSRNLIIIGKNGAGKTSFLKSLHTILLQNISEGHAAKLSEYRKLLAENEKKLARDPGYQGTVDHYKRVIEENVTPLVVTYNALSDFIEKTKEGNALIRYYEATRKIAITKVTSASPITPELPQHKKKENLGPNLEQHLVNLEIVMALAMRRNNPEKTRRIEGWFHKFQEDLKFLFEDDSIHLVFDDEKLAFLLQQEKRPPYSFQNLSSGYLAIFDIYADLLVRSEYFEILPTELVGIVLIDELDAHLHISLQRKILPFFARSFPKIQFIVTTHSPFVVSSTDDSLIYDISTGKECEDLSLFSIEHIIEGVLGVPPISQKMQGLISELTTSSNNPNSSADELKKLLITLAPHADTLDDESRMFYEIAQNRYLNKKRDDHNV